VPRATTTAPESRRCVTSSRHAFSGHHIVDVKARRDSGEKLCQAKSTHMSARPRFFSSTDRSPDVAGIRTGTDLVPSVATRSGPSCGVCQPARCGPLHAGLAATAFHPWTHPDSALLYCPNITGFRGSPRRVERRAVEAVPEHVLGIR
jgi:hypothetical protein